MGSQYVLRHLIFNQLSVRQYFSFSLGLETFASENSFLVKIFFALFQDWNGVHIFKKEKSQIKLHQNLLKSFNNTGSFSIQFSQKRDVSSEKTDQIKTWPR